MDKSRGAVALQMPYLRVVDLQEESEAHANDTFSNAGQLCRRTAQGERGKGGRGQGAV